MMCCVVLSNDVCLCLSHFTLLQVVEFRLLQPASKICLVAQLGNKQGKQKTNRRRLKKQE